METSPSPSSPSPSSPQSAGPPGANSPTPVDLTRLRPSPRARLMLLGTAAVVTGSLLVPVLWAPLATVAGLALWTPFAALMVRRARRSGPTLAEVVQAQHAAGGLWLQGYARTSLRDGPLLHKRATLRIEHGTVTWCVASDAPVVVPAYQVRVKSTTWLHPEVPLAVNGATYRLTQLSPAEQMFANVLGLGHDKLAAAIAAALAPWPPPGWYPDAHGHTRWWDGQQWTAVAPNEPISPTAPPP